MFLCGCVRECFLELFYDLGVIFTILAQFLSHFGVILGSFWSHFGLQGALGTLLGALGRSWGHLESI